MAKATSARGQGRRGGASPGETHARRSGPAAARFAPRSRRRVRRYQAAHAREHRRCPTAPAGRTRRCAPARAARRSPPPTAARANCPRCRRPGRPIARARGVPPEAMRATRDASGWNTAEPRADQPGGDQDHGKTRRPREQHQPHQRHAHPAGEREPSRGRRSVYNPTKGWRMEAVSWKVSVMSRFARSRAGNAISAAGTPPGSPPGSCH